MRTMRESVYVEMSWLLVGQVAWRLATHKALQGSAGAEPPAPENRCFLGAHGQEVVGRRPCGGFRRRRASDGLPPSF